MSRSLLWSYPWLTFGRFQNVLEDANGKDIEEKTTKLKWRGMMTQTMTTLLNRCHIRGSHGCDECKEEYKGKIYDSPSEVICYAALQYRSVEKNSASDRDDYKRQ